MITKFLTRKRAIELCIELWTWLAVTGEWEKSYWPRWPELIALYGGDVWGYCWFCEYDSQMEARYQHSFTKKKNCKYCPLIKLYGGCASTYYSDWEESINREEKKEYAAKFLAEIEAIAISTK